MPTRIPPLPALRAFEAAARLMSFKRAAAELHVTPGAVSQQIKALEAQLGVALFMRRTRALELTDAARSMLPPLRQALALLAAAVESTQESTPRGRLAVVAPPSFAARWLVARLPAFCTRHPEVELRVSSSPDAIDRRDAGNPRAAFTPIEADVVIRFGRGDYPGYRSTRLFSPAYVPACSPALLEGANAIRQVHDLARQTMIHDHTVPELDDRPSWDQWLALAGVSREKRAGEPHFDDAGLVIAAVQAGQGVALVAKPLVSAEVAAGRLATPFELSIASPFAYFATRQEGCAQRPAILAFVDWISAAARAEDRGAPPPV